MDSKLLLLLLYYFIIRLYKLVKPRQVLYLAVDGVAPRAKMNQQRSRRFRSAKEAEQTAAEILARTGTLSLENRFDSNCITPGTDFMLKLSLALAKMGAIQAENGSLLATWSRCHCEWPRCARRRRT